MIIACSKEGRLCNRLFHFSHFIANALENQLELSYLFFEEYLHYFDKNLSVELSKKGIQVHSSIYRKVYLYLFARLTPKIFQNTRFYTIIRSHQAVNLGDKSLLLRSATSCVFAYGWLYRDYANFKKHAGYIRNIFTFKPETIKIVTERLSKFKSNDIVLVGVHIRRGDYQKYQGGKYFYSDEIYLEKMNQLEKIFLLHGKTTCFLVVSNDPRILQNSSYTAPNVLIHSAANPIEDLCALSQCNYLIGPPSSFTSWASFHGSVPLQFIESSAQELTLHSFEINCG